MSPTPSGHPYEHHDSPAAAGPPAGPPRRRRIALLASIAAAGSAALVLGGGTAAGASTDVPPGTTALGVDIGGRSTAAATQALVAGTAARLTEPVLVRVGRTLVDVDPNSVDLHLDASATVERAARGWPNPVRVLLGGQHPVEPVVTVNEDKLESLLVMQLKDSAAKPAAVRFQGVTPRAVYAVAGQGVDPVAASAALREGWLRGGTIAMPLTPSVPLTPNAEVDRAVRDLARPAVAAPVTVTTPGARLTLPPSVIAKSLVITADTSGALKPRINEAKLRSAWAGRLARVETVPHEAAPPADGGNVIIASAGGRLVDTARLSQDLLKVLAQPSPREVSATMRAVNAKANKPDLAKQGIVEPISSFTTYYDGGQERNKNIIQVAKEVDGAIVKPGQTFSLNGYTGPRGYAEGYVDAPVISDGKLVNAVGGGISQFTTTLFNAAYYAGLEDVFHQPHSYYFSRYPPVIESTIFYPSLDMKFRNDAGASVLIETAYDDRSVTVTMWGTKRYDISTEWAPRTNVTKPKTVHLKDDEGCIATRGLDGFSQQAWRIFKQRGKEVKRELFAHTYRAEPHFVCGP